MASIVFFGATVAMLSASIHDPATIHAARVVAIIAYLQPVSRPEIARIRGVASESALHTLTERGLIEEAGRSRFGAVIHRTTPLFLPHLQGERAPIWDIGARGAFIGLDGSMGPADLTRAVFEGVASSVRWLLEALEASAGRPATYWLVSQISVGGATTSSRPAAAAAASSG